MESKRLILRKYTQDDAEALYSWAKSEKVGPAAGWHPHKNLEESKMIIDKVYNGETEDAYAIVYKENNKVIGTISLFKDLLRDNINSKELGYVLSCEYWGKGIMTEAGLLMLDYGFNTLNLNHISIRHYSYNDKSKRVIEKLGFLPTGYIRYAYLSPFDGNIYDSYLYSMTKNDYENNNK